MRVNVARHDADLAAARKLCIRAFATHAPRWSDDAWAVGSDERRAWIAFEHFLHADHVLHGHAFGDRADHTDARIGGLNDRVGCTGWRHEDHGRIGACRLHGVEHRIEDRQTVRVLLPALARGHAADKLRAVFKAGLRVRGACAASDSLANDFRVSVDEDRHRGAEDTRLRERGLHTNWR